MANKASGNAVFGFFGFRLIGSEQPVPDHQYAAKVFVDIDGVSPMVYAMRGGAVNNALQSAPFPNGFRVHKKLIQQIEPITKGNIDRGKTSEGQWQKEERTDRCSEPVETIGSGQVYIGA